MVMEMAFEVKYKLNSDYLSFVYFRRSDIESSIACDKLHTLMQDLIWHRMSEGQSYFS